MRYTWTWCRARWRRWTCPWWPRGAGSSSAAAWRSSRATRSASSMRGRTWTSTWAWWCTRGPTRRRGARHAFARHRRGRHPDARRRGVQHAPRLSRRRRAQAHRVEGARARAGPAHEGVQRHGLERAVARLGGCARGRSRSAPVDPLPLGAAGRALRPGVRAAAAGVALNPTRGEAHCARCLETLALFEVPR